MAEASEDRDQGRELAKAFANGAKAAAPSGPAPKRYGPNGSPVGTAPKRAASDSAAAGPAPKRTASGSPPTGAEKTSPQGARSFGEGMAVLRGRIEIDLDKRIPRPDSGRAPAFAASDKGDPGRALFALVCDPGVPHRSKPLEALRGRLHKNLLSVVVDGVLSPKGADGSRLAIVLERPQGRTLAEVLKKAGKGLGERVVIGDILPQLLAALRDLDEAGTPHRGLRPDNIFFADKAEEILTLGDFITVPPGFFQPVAYEPLESAQAMPSGRGPGTMASDIYALGVTVLTLLSGTDPRDRWDDDELNVARLTQGSITALVGNLRFPPAILELLRGTLSDDPEQRWDLDEIDGWTRGRRGLTKRVVLSRRAVQPLMFNGRGYTYDLELVHAFVRNPVEAQVLIRAPEFEEWVRVGLQDTTLAQRFSEIVARARLGTKGGPAPANLITQVANLIHPQGPLRHGRIALTPAGIGPIFSDAFARKDAMLLKALGDLLTGRLPGQWMTARRARGFPAGLSDRIAEIGDLLARDSLGFGAERCLYELNPSLPCLSQFVAKYWVTRPSELLPALDQAAQNSRRISELLDRHVTGFIAARSQAAAVVLGNAAGSGLDNTRLALELFHYLQTAFKIEPVPNLTKWLAARLDPVVKNYHSRQKRKAMKDKIAAQRDSGIVADLLVLVRTADQEDSIDVKMFQTAAARYLQFQADLDELRNNTEGVVKEGKAVGGQASNALTIVLLLLSVVLVSFGLGAG